MMLSCETYRAHHILRAIHAKTMISSLSFQQFKSYRDAKLPLAPLTLLIGANASGKSNAIEGLRFLSWFAEGRRLDRRRAVRPGSGPLCPAGRVPARACPPAAGALPEEAFDGACIRCGLCVRDCPYDMLYLGRVGEDIPTGTPYFIARQAACEMCEDIPCVAACPTNALDHTLTDIDDARMGLAVLVDQETCIAFQGLRCEVCYQVCPIKDQAITLDRQHNERSGKHALFIPVVHSDRCTGCGKCEEVCILEKAAIKVLPQHLAKGELGGHYRLGWEQKARSGGPLVSPDPEHRYHLPEGMEYDHAGEGLIGEGRAVAPFPDNPLDILNRQGPR